MSIISALTLHRIALLLAGLLLAASPLRAQLVVEITRGDAQAVPIAVVPFGWEGAGGPPFDLAAVIDANLRRTGLFDPMQRGDMVSRPTSAAGVEFRDWRLLGTDVLVIGRMLEQPGDQYEIQFQVFDIVRGQQMMGYRTSSNRRGLRSMAHRISDMIYERLTGVPGAFNTRIAYITVEGNPPNRTHRLIVADSDGENEGVIAESPQPLMSPAWSPDARRLAYVSFEGGQSAIYVQTLRTGDRQRVSARAGINGAPVFSPDGRRLALVLSRETGRPDIYTLDLASQMLTRLTDSAAIDTEPEWSPDGRWIYFTSDRGGGPQIYRAPADAPGRAQRVTFEGRYNARPRLSPDGRSMAVVHNDGGNFRIALVDLERNTTLVLTDGSLDESPSFAPNGATLIYATRAGGRGVLATVSADGRVRQRLTVREGQVQEPAWSPLLGP
jgi:TolB protein